MNKKHCVESDRNCYAYSTVGSKQQLNGKQFPQYKRIKLGSVLTFNSPNLEHSELSLVLDSPPCIWKIQNCHIIRLPTQSLCLMKPFNSGLENHSEHMRTATLAKAMDGFPINFNVTLVALMQIMMHFQ